MEQEHLVRQLELHLLTNSERLLQNSQDQEIIKVHPSSEFMEILSIIKHRLDSKLFNEMI